MLEVTGLTVAFGGTKALDGVDLAVAEGSMHGLIGPNGAGKTSLFNAVAGVYGADSGQIAFRGQDLLASPARARASLGIARTFQNLGLFTSMTVYENVLCGAHARGTETFGSALVRLRAPRRLDRALGERAMEILTYLNLQDQAHAHVSDLPFGTMKRVELGRALASEPTLLMLDEPANGLTQYEVDELATLIADLKERFALTLLLVEHHMGMVMRLCDEITVLNAGRNVVTGSPDVVRSDPRVIEAYLGGAV